MTFLSATSGTLDVEDDSDVMLQWSTNELYFPNVGRPIHFGDFDSDGLDDLAVGTPNVANGSYSPGGVIILPGQ